MKKRSAKVFTILAKALFLAVVLSIPEAIYYSICEYYGFKQSYFLNYTYAVFSGGLMQTILTKWKNK